MSRFIIKHRFHPENDYRVLELAKFLEFSQRLFDCRAFFDDGDNPINLEQKHLEAFLKSQSDLGKAGITFDLFSLPPSERNDQTEVVEVHTRTAANSQFIDSLTLKISSSFSEDHLYSLEELVSIIRPFEAFVAEWQNERDLDSHGRQRTIQNFSRPSILRGWHFLDERLVTALGGIDKCLNTPAYNVRRMNNGVLIILCKGIFSSDNTEHLAIQRRAMEYLDLT